MEANTGTIDINSSATTLTTGSLFIGAGQTTLSGRRHHERQHDQFQRDIDRAVTFQGNGVLYGVLTWTGGQLGTSDQALTIATNAVLVLAGAANSTYNMGQPLSNEGTIYLQSGNFQIDWGNWGSLTNLPGGVVDFASDVSIQYSGGPGFVNQGTLVKSGGTGTSTINSFSNSGTVEANTGTININSSATTLTTGSQFIGAGQTTFSGGTVTMNGSLISSKLVLAGATLQSNGALYGVLTWTGGQLGNADQALTIAANAVLVLAGAANSTYNMGQPLSNEGTIYLQSGNFQIDWGN